MAVHYCDTKNNVTHTFRSAVDDGAIAGTQTQYDDYGLKIVDLNNETDSEKPASPSPPSSYLNTYEGRFLHEKSGLIDTGARWYDPLVGRFATPDDVTDLGLLYGTDGLNRHAFENNDPINHTDPTGHFSWNGVLGVVASAALIGLGFAATALTGGAAAPLAMVIIGGALTAGGFAGAMYSVEHFNEKDTGKFWGGWGMTVGINAAIGAATAGVTAGVGAAVKSFSASTRLGGTLTTWAAGGGTKVKLAKAALRMGGDTLLEATTSIFSGAGQRHISNVIYGTNHDVWAGAGDDFGTAACKAFFKSGLKQYSTSSRFTAQKKSAGEIYKNFRDPGFSNVYSEPGAWEGMFRNAGGKMSDPILKGLGGSGAGSSAAKEAFKVVWSNPFNK